VKVRKRVRRKAFNVDTAELQTGIKVFLSPYAGGRESLHKNRLLEKEKQKEKRDTRGGVTP